MAGLVSAIQDFRKARQQAKLEEVMARLRGRSLDLLDYEDVRRKLRASNMIERGLEVIPLDAIVGSVGRYRDFTRTFLPRNDSDESRWAQVSVAQTERGLPPINVYQIGDVYFVQDGNHRVSIARLEGLKTIEAYVTEVQTKVPLSPDVQPDDLILKAEYVDFLNQTKLDVLRPETDLSLTLPGKYPLLLEHIDVHQYYMGLEEQRDVSYEEAVMHWHDTVYQPVISLIQQLGVMREFPGRTEADLYVWLADHRAEIEKALGWEVSTAATISDLVSQVHTKEQPLVNRILNVFAPSEEEMADSWWRKRFLAQPNSRLFNTILVPIRAADIGWGALDNALYWAKCEQCQVIGLFAVESKLEREGIVAQTVAETFRAHAAAANVPAHFKIEVGDLDELTRQLARWVDLIVLPTPPSAQADSLYRIQTMPGPLLIAPNEIVTLQKVLLVYEGNNHFDDASAFIAAYISHSWQIPLCVVVPNGREKKLRSAISVFEIEVEMRSVAEIAAKVVLPVVREEQADLIVLGGDLLDATLNLPRLDLVEAFLNERPTPILVGR